MIDTFGKNTEANAVEMEYKIIGGRKWGVYYQDMIQTCMDFQRMQFKKNNKNIR